MEPMLNIALRAAREAGEHIVRAGERLDRLTIESKSVNDYVSNVDREAELIILDTLKEKFPAHAFLSEASHTQPSNPDADEQGHVTMPNVNLMEEMVNMIGASRAFEANTTAVKTLSDMALKALQIGR